MAVKLTKDAIDLGIVVRDAQASLAFYRDTLGLEQFADQALPEGRHLYRLACGQSVVKLLSLGSPPEAKAPGGIAGGAGYRYWTVWVSNLDDVVATCRAAGYTVPMERTQLRPGVHIAMVEDPDGNYVELLEDTTQ